MQLLCQEYFREPKYYWLIIKMVYENHDSKSDLAGSHKNLELCEYFSDLHSLSGVSGAVMSGILVFTKILLAHNLDSI